MKNWSRTHKLLFFLVTLVISLFFISSISNWNSPTPEIAFRRAEKRNLIGPSEIIAKLNFPDSSYNQLWIGETDFGYATFEFNDSIPYQDYSRLRYFNKAEDTTIFSTYDLYGYGSGLPYLPIFLFQENQNALTAQMKLTITSRESSGSFNLGSHKEAGGYFLFVLPAGPELKSDCFWLLQQAITNGYREYELTGTVEIQVTFYDRQGNPVDTYSQTVTK